MSYLARRRSSIRRWWSIRSLRRPIRSGTSRPHWYSGTPGSHHVRGRTLWSTWTHHTRGRSKLLS